MTYRAASIILSALMLAACGDSGPSSASGQAGSAPLTSTPIAASTAHSEAPPAAHDIRQFRNDHLGFRIDYPHDMASSTHFDSKYLAADNWKTYVRPGSTGSSVLMLTVPGSNHVTAAQLRIGISSNQDAVAQCTQPPSNADPASISKTTINGTTFTRFHAADAAMSHYLKVHSYRTVHDGDCYAIDLLVTGTHPQVYDPPRKPPFSHADAFAQLHQALEGFRFTR